MNVTCKASEEQMSVLFSFVGPIVKIDLYPKGDEMVANKVSRILVGFLVSKKYFRSHSFNSRIKKM